MSTNTETKEEGESNAFAVALASIGYGELAAQASESLTELVRRVHETGSKGKLSLTIEVKPRGRDSGQVEVSGTVKPTFPIPESAASMFFANEEGQLLKDNPNQGQLPFGDERPKHVASQ